MTEIKRDERKITEQLDNLEVVKKENIEDVISLKCVTSPKPTSLSSLIIWNISKAEEKSPSLDIKDAVALTQCRLEQVSDSTEAHSILSEQSYERHLACALLAWQQLGHNSADSLCRFVEKKRNEENMAKLAAAREVRLRAINEPHDCEPIIYQPSEESAFSKALSASNTNSNSMGPVIKLPIETNIVMRVDNATCGRPQAKKPKALQKQIIGKIEKACCMTSPCLEVLSAMDAGADELRRRACLLAQREAERARLLERAEAAWKDLELGYQRRLALAVEKEEDITKQITKLIKDRASYKESCMAMTQTLKEKSNKAEQNRAELTQMEKTLYERACQRLKLNGECARGDSLVAEQSCRVNQLDTDLMFKEEQARRRLSNLENEVQSAQALTLEAERAMRAELNAMRDQIAEISNQLLEEDAQIDQTKAELEYLRQEKMEIVEDLEGCKVMCDGRMQGKVDELHKKREQLAASKEKLMNCRCKKPVDVSVEVKRTPSFAAMCHCAPEDRILDSCSCTSMRTQLLSNLLSDLFGGLQFEMSGSIARLPCQLLKCLEDRHNWDRTSQLKTNLKNYFDKLLTGELDIAIVTSIEKYHAKWARPTCVDAVKPPGPHDVETEGWQERAIERRAQKLASQLAEQLFEERAEELTERAKRIVERGPPPCECEPEIEIKTKPDSCHCEETPATQLYWHQTAHGLTQPRRLQDVKKNILKKDDFKVENKIAKATKPSTQRAARCLPERDAPTSMSRRPVKRFHDRAGGSGTLCDRNLTNVGLNQTAVFPCLIENTVPNIEPVNLTSPYWRQAVEDVNRLRLQIEDLKKESIKKEDLKLLEDKIAEIVLNASVGASTNVKIDYPSYVIDESDIVNNKHMQKSHEAQSQASQNVDESKHGNKKKQTNTYLQNKTRSNTKSILKYGVDKPFKLKKNKNDNVYAINVCLCDSKKQQPKASIEKNKFEISEWKRRISKDSSSMSSTYKQTKPIYQSVFSQNMSPRTNDSKESDYQSCPSNCVCFHKTPSNTSIDKLLETLAKWKGDLDASMHQCTREGGEKSSSYGFIQPNVVCLLSQDHNASSKSKASLKLEEKSQQSISVIQDSDKKIKKNIDKNTKNVEKSSAKPIINPLGAIDSEYMGTVNFEKSNDEIYKCDNDTKKTSVMPFQCIASSRCSCRKILKTRRLEDQVIHTKNVKYQDANAIRIKQDQKDKAIIIVENTPHNESCNRYEYLDNEPNNICNKVKSRPYASESSDYQIKFLGVTLVESNFPLKNHELIVENTCSLPRDETNKNKTNQHGVQNQIYTNSNQLPKISDVSSDRYNKNQLNDGEKVEIKHENINETVEGLKKKSKILLGKLSELNVHNSLLEDKPTKIYDQKEDLFKEKKISKHLKLGSQDINRKNPNQAPTCDCGVKVDDLKKFLNIIFNKHITSADAALDTQSFNQFKIKNESCVCCSKLKTEESKDLEDNAFHLLEEFLKKNLEEFKASSSNPSCISQEEEEKMFSIILQKVKQLISDSTSDVKCKCLILEEKSQGSWNRAYGLLQEYIKMKIKKAHCSCLEENNYDSVLANVLEKICNMIEVDFKRLKNLCCSRLSNINSQEIARKSLKQVNFEAKPPEKYTSPVLPDLKNEVFGLLQNNDDQVYNCATNKKETKAKQHIKIKTSTYSSENCKDLDQNNYKVGSLRTSVNTIEPINDVFFLLCSDDSNRDKNNEVITETQNQEMYDTSFTNIESSSQPVISPYTNNTKERNEVPNFGVNNTTVKAGSETINILNFNNLMTHNLNDNLKIDEVIKTDVKLTKKNEKEIENTSVFVDMYCSRAEQVNSPCINEGKHQQSSTISMHNKITQNSEQSENVARKFSNGPYIGYTINCSCHDSIELYTCQKHISNVDIDVVNNIWKSSIPDETYLKKFSYIMHGKCQENIDSNEALQENANEVFLPHALCETTSCSNKEEQIVLKKSTSNIQQAHETTNTFVDNTSLDIDYSINDESLNWCECSSQEDHSKRLKSSLNIPVPLDFGEIDELVSNKSRPLQTNVKSRKHVCDCETVPICHVKMLVENIENKLANANCTCDSLIPKVCPVHSTLC